MLSDLYRGFPLRRKCLLDEAASLRFEERESVTDPRQSLEQLRLQVLVTDLKLGTTLLAMAIDTLSRQWEALHEVVQ